MKTSYVIRTCGQNILLSIYKNDIWYILFVVDVDSHSDAKVALSIKFKNIACKTMETVICLSTGKKVQSERLSNLSHTNMSRHKLKLRISDNSRIFNNKHNTLQWVWNDPLNYHWSVGFTFVDKEYIHIGIFVILDARKIIVISHSAQQ